MKPRREIIIGGLGGGGDVALALMIMKTYNSNLESVAVVSFNRCRAKKQRLHNIRIEGALLRVPPNYFPSKRIFEDKLYLLEPELASHTYIVCTRDPFNDVVEGLEWIIKNYNPSIMLHTDIGGDSLIMGYEEKMGSYTTDTIARAALATISMKYNVKSYLAVACVGCEGGGTELNHYELAANLIYASNKGALIRTLILPKEVINIGYTILRYTESGMLPMLLAALRGLKYAEIHQAYLNGTFPIKPWYKCTYILDNEKYCKLSPICRTTIEKGRLPKHDKNVRVKPPYTQKPDPNKTLVEICRQYLPKNLTM